MTLSSTGSNPFLFACGVPRSGTTLLQRMLNSHPQLAVANDSHFIPRALELTDKSLVARAVAGLPVPLTEELAGNVRDYHRFHRLGISPEQFSRAVSESDTYQALVSNLYILHGRNEGKPLAGEKTPDYARRLALLHGMFPRARLIHLIRDGRNVSNSD